MSDPLSPTTDTQQRPMHIGRGKPQIVTYCGEAGCFMGTSLSMMGKTHMAQMLRYYGWSETKARGWVCPDHATRTRRNP